jgi:hypothetical protein
VIMEAVCTSETPINSYEITRCIVAENCHLRSPNESHIIRNPRVNSPPGNVSV